MPAVSFANGVTASLTGSGLAFCLGQSVTLIDVRGNDVQALGQEALGLHDALIACEAALNSLPNAASD